MPETLRSVLMAIQWLYFWFLLEHASSFMKFLDDWNNFSVKFTKGCPIETQFDFKTSSWIPDFNQAKLSIKTPNEELTFI